MPDDYGASRLSAQAATLTGPGVSLATMAGFDVGLSRGMLLYMRHLHLGRIDPRAIGFHLTVPPDGHEFVPLLRDALAGGHLAGMVAALRPPLALYAALRARLGDYRRLAADVSLADVSALPVSLDPGDVSGDLAPLARRLSALGDLPPGDAALPAAGVYAGALVDAVRRFQVRHGLEPDGVIGKRTSRELSMPLAWRVRQIEFSLERLRWLPDLNKGRVVFVNIPMFHLWAWEAADADLAPSLEAGVIVGEALDHQTPVFVEDMRYLVFRPYWNLPRSIVETETLPAIAADPGYLARQDMELVRGGGDDARPVPATAENLARLAAGELRVRQRPGPKNALGLVKFVFPNDEAVYLHDSPAAGLFAEARRDFSHGCVRVERPAALAGWVLRDQAEWTPRAIAAAMRAGDNRVVPLATPVQVVLAYLTAMVDPSDGAMRFADDLYDHDTRLDAALHEPRLR